MNKVVITGIVPNDVDVRMTASGSKIANFSVAVKRTFKNHDGEYETDFIPVTVFGNTAQYVENNIQKRDRVAVSGRLQIDKYTDKDGNKHSKTTVIAENVEIILKAQNQNFNNNSNNSSSSNSQSGFSEPNEVFTKELPF